MNTSSIWPLRTSTTAAPRREARKPTASASASTKPSCRSSIRWRSVNASTPASSSCRLTSIPGSPGTTNSDHIRGAGVTARRQCKPSLTPSHSPGRNQWPPDVGQTQPFRHQTGQLSDQVSATTPNYRILAHQRSRFTHYYFYLRDETLGPMVMRVASFFPFRTTYYLNGHSFIEQELKRAQIGFRKSDNALLAVDDVAALQAAADKLSPEIIRKRLDYWTLILGPKFSAKERKQLNLSRFYAIAQIEYCRNFIFKRNFPIHKLFERSCELGLWRLTPHKIVEIFRIRLNRNMRGKLATVIDRIEHGHHVFRAYFKHAFLKQYEKFATFLRNELVSNNLADFHPKKGLEHRESVRDRFQTITGRFAGFQAQWLNVHVDFPLLQRLGLPITIGAVRYPGIKIHEPRVIRLLEVLLHGGSQVGGWTAKQIHYAVFTTFHLSHSTYGLNQLRYDLRKLKAHGLLQRDGSCYAYRLTPKGVQVALLFLFFHKRLCGPLANSRFHHRPDPQHQPASKLEAAYHRADKAIQQIVDLLAA